MKLKILKVLVLILCSAGCSFACDCKIFGDLKVTQNRELKNSKLIFIGEVLKIDPLTNSFEIKVIESFKGVKNDKIYHGTYDVFCSPIIDEVGNWLIYARFTTKNQIEIYACGLTRSFINPERNIHTSEMLPPPKEESSKVGLQKCFQKFESERRLSAKKDLELEIETIRLKTK